MNKPKLLSALLWWTLAIVLWAHAIPKILAFIPVEPSFQVPGNILDSDEMFEYCGLPKKDPQPNQQYVFATPAPFEPVTLNTQGEPASEPFNIDNFQVDVVRMGEFKEENFHFVMVGVGYTNEENEAELRSIIEQVKGNFTNVNVDFAYLRVPVDIDFKHIMQQVVFSNDGDEDFLLKKIKSVYPADSIVVGLNTNLYLGTSHDKTAVFSSSDPIAAVIASHEMGHQLGLPDGYRAFYSKLRIPNTELFYIDSIPRDLNEALKKLPEQPPMYLVGTCDGKPLYSFYESNNNPMRDWNPTHPNSWGDTFFTPLQIQIMNNFIQKNK